MKTITIQYFLQNVTRVMRVLMIIFGLIMASSQSTFALSIDESIHDEICTDCVDIGPTDPIHIAYALVTSGPLSYLGTDELNGINIAMDDVGGKILGHTIQLDGEDSQCSPEGGDTAGQSLDDDPTIVAVIGTSCSNAAATAMPYISAAGMSMVSPSNTGPVLTEPGNPSNYPGYYRTALNDKFQADFSAGYVYNILGVTSAATINYGSEWSNTLAQAFTSEFTNLGGTITTQQVIAPGQTDMSTELADIAAGSPELLYLPVFMPEAGYIITQARGTSGLETIYLMGALYDEGIVSATGTALEGFLTTEFDDSQNSDYYFNHVAPAYKAKYGNPTTYFHAHAYDAFMVIKAAIEATAVEDPDNTLHISRQGLRDALSATSNFPGLTGKLSYQANGDLAEAPNYHFGIYKYHTGQFPPWRIWPNMEYRTETYKSQGVYDGWVLESGENTGVGGTKNKLGKVLQVGDNAQDKQYRIILSFGTAAIPDSAVITKVILKIKRAGVVGTNPMKTHNGLVVDIKKGKFYTLPTLQINDFQAKPGKFKVGKFPKTPFSGNWYRAVLYTGAYDYINVKGRTQLRLRFLLDDNNDNGADIIKLYSGNAILANRPQLIVRYYLP